MRRGSPSRVRGLIGIGGLLAALALGGAAPTTADAAVTPIVDCMTPDSNPGVYLVYFGYVNTGDQTTITFGDDNQIVPGLGYQGQPTVFNAGSYPRVLRAIFNSNAFPAIAWELAGTEALATADTPLCAAGATGPVSDLGQTSATLNGVVDSRGTDTAYRFEYGPTIAYGESTPEQHLTGASGRPVSAAIAGLAPDTTYHYRLVANGSESTVGEDRTFTTAATPPPVASLVLTRSGPRKARVGRKVSASFTVANEGPSRATGVRLVAHAPAGLRIGSAAGPGGPCAGRSARTCEIGSVAPGSAATVTMRIAAKRRGRLDYWAAVTGDQLDANAGDNVAGGSLRGRR
jgi:hypothetical protein